MRIISFLEDQEVINKILEHVGFWQTNQRPHPNPKHSNFKSTHRIPNFFSMKRLLIRISGLPRIIRPSEIKENQDVKGVVCPNFGIQPPLFPLSPSICKIQTCKVPFSSEDPLCRPAFGPIFLLDRVFFLSYTLFIKSKIL